MNTVYLDHCATTPLDPSVAQAMASARDSLTGNPSSIHRPGRRARSVMVEARTRIARSLETAPSNLVFTASGSEANNLALKGFVLHHWPSPVRLVVSAIEHDSVRNAARYLADRFDQVSLTEIRPDAGGRIDPERVREASSGDVRTLISVMALNNETGVVQPVELLGRTARECGASFHCDAVQALGRIEVHPQAWGCDYLTLSAHKIQGPRGIGLLYARPGAALDPLIHGGHQEGGRRAGTENAEAIVGFATAMERSISNLASNLSEMVLLDEAFLATLREIDSSFAINADPRFRAPGVLNLAFPGIASHDLVVGMDLSGFAISAGSACSSGVIEPSHVLRAMSLDAWRIEGGIRISFGKSNTPVEARQAGRALGELVQRLRAESATISSS